MNTPLFSIILPTYNRRSFLVRSIESVLLQEYTDWELIVIDDGSADDTKEYVLGLQNEKIKYTFQKNKGRSVARNLGVNQAIGEYVCFLDSDDELKSEYLSSFHKTICESSYNLLLAGVQINSLTSFTTVLPIEDRTECIVQCLEGYFNLMPFCFHKSLMINNRFDDSLYYGEDYNFLIPIIAHNSINIILNDTSIVHQHPNRTINKIYENVPGGYKQFQKSVLETIDNNFILLSQFVAEERLTKIKKNKTSDYILTAAKYNLKEAYIINRTQNIISINNFKLLFQRIKGLIQSI